MFVPLLDDVLLRSFLNELCKLPLVLSPMRIPFEKFMMHKYACLVRAGLTHTYIIQETHFPLETSYPISALVRLRLEKNARIIVASLLRMIYVIPYLRFFSFLSHFKVSLLFKSFVYKNIRNSEKIIILILLDI